MSDAKKSLRIIEKDVDLQSKRGIRAILSDGASEVEKFIYPLMSLESDVFFDELKQLKNDYLPEIQGYFSGAGKKFALSEAQEGSLMIECRDKLEDRIVIEMCKDLAETMESIHSEGFAFAGLSARDILINEDGLVLPPPAFAATEEHIVEDFASVGGICYELLTGVEYKPGNVVSEDTLPDTIPYGARIVIVNATGKDREKNYREAKPIIRAFETKKKKSVAAKPAPFEKEAVPEKTRSSNTPAKRKKKKKKALKRFLRIATLVLVVAALAALAAVIIHGIASNKGDSYDELTEKAYLAIADGQYEEAKTLAEKAAAQDSEHLTAYYCEALALYKAEDYESAVSFIDQNIMKKSFTLKENENSVPQDLYYIFGCSYYQLGDYENAYKSLNSAEEKGYDAAKTAPMLLKCALAMDNSSAIAVVMQKDTMGDGGKTYTEAVEEEANGNFNAAAVKYYEASTKLTDNAAKEYCIRRTAAAYLKAEEYDSVINSCNNSLTEGISMNLAIELWGHKASAVKAKAKLTNDDELFTQAIETYEKYMEIGGSDVEPECYYCIGECYLYLRNAETGKEALMKAFESGDETWSAKAEALMDANGLLAQQPVVEE